MFLGEKVRLVVRTIRYLHDINSIKISSVIGLFDLNISSKNKIWDLTDFRFNGHPSAPISPLNRGFTVYKIIETSKLVRIEIFNVYNTQHRAL